ncbi:MAG: ATP-binding protein [Chloroflexota bacterium]
MIKSFRARVILAYTGLILLVVVSLAVAISGTLERLLLTRLSDDLMIEARLVALQVGDDLAAGRRDGVRRTLSRIDALTPARALVFDPDGLVLGVSEAEDQPLLGRVVDQAGFAEAVGGEEVSGTAPRAEAPREVLYVAVPVVSASRVVGAVRLAYTLKDVESTLTRLNLGIAAGTLVVGLLAAGVSYALATTMTRPIRALSAAAKAVSNGVYEQIPARSRADELGELIGSFNEMSASLAEYETARREFASDFSHELHSLSSAMQTAATALARGAREDPMLAERLTNGLVGHTYRLGRLADDVLQLARLEGGQMGLAVAECRLEAVVERTIDEFEAEARRAGVSLLRRGDVPMPWRGDAARIGQAMGNLIENAIKYTPAGGQVRVAATTTRAGYVIEVSDTGIGIPEDQRRFVFHRYYRVEGRASAGPSGTGLGLAIAQRIVLAHGGDIDVLSPTEGGTTFRITLPRVAASASADGHAVDSERGSKNGRLAADPARV